MRWHPILHVRTLSDANWWSEDRRGFLKTLINVWGAKKYLKRLSRNILQNTVGGDWKVKTKDYFAYKPVLNIFISLKVYFLYIISILKFKKNKYIKIFKNTV